MIDRSLASASLRHAGADRWATRVEIIRTKGNVLTIFALHKIAMLAVAIAVGSAGIATDAWARGGGGGHGGGGGGHFGGGMGGGHLGGMGGGHFGGGMGGVRPGAGAHLGGALGAGHLGGLGGRFGAHRFGGSGRRFAHHRGFQGFGFGDPLGYYDDYGYDQCWQIDRIRPSRLRYVC